VARIGGGVDGVHLLGFHLLTLCEREAIGHGRAQAMRADYLPNSDEEGADVWDSDESTRGAESSEVARSESAGSAYREVT